ISSWPLSSPTRNIPLGKASSTSPSISIFSSPPIALVLSRSLSDSGSGPRRGSRARGRAQRLDCDDVRRLRAFRALAGLVLDLCILGEGLEPVARDVA